MSNPPRFRSISTRLESIAKLAREMPGVALKTLSHYIDVGFLVRAYELTRKDGAVGVDGQTAKEYEANLVSNLRSLLDRFKSGMYRAPPVRRVHIPKGDGTKTRPIGIPTFEDKVLQRAVVMVMESVYEQDFSNSSYGFRPGRSAHQALKSLWDQAMAMGGGWVIDADISAFFDTLDRDHLRSFLDQRVRDRVLRRVIGKWLQAGVLEDGVLTRAASGTPQGGVVSPLLANIYLHEVLDTWFENDVKPRLTGKAFLIRYADDFVVMFSNEEDARRVLQVLPKRFGKYGLELHPDKTRLVEFRRPRGDDEPPPGSFDFLGFTHHWCRSRRGNWTVRQKTAKSRLGRGLKAISVWCKRNLHLPVGVQQSILTAKLRGHYAYYGITGNQRALKEFLNEVERVWKNQLNSRSQRARMTWERFHRLLKRFPLPQVRVVHSVMGAANP